MDARSKNLFKDRSNARNKKAKPFIVKERIMYKMGQDNRKRRCLTTSEA
jgi:hypothetical protein